MPTIATSGSESDSDGSVDLGIDEEGGAGYRSRNHRVSIPAFTGKETWRVWFTRFNETAKRQGLSHGERLDLLLPKLRGEAGTFAFDQLSAHTRTNYKLLTKELESRFRKVENPKTYCAVFAARRQKAGEEIEAYACVPATVRLVV